MKLPQPTADAIADLRRIGRYLDHLADTTLSDYQHAIAYEHAIKCWLAIERVEALAELVEDLAQLAGPLGRPDPLERQH